MAKVPMTNPLNDVDAEARAALRLIGPDPANWVPERPGIDNNVAIVGGGQSGCAFAFALRRAGVGKVTVIDMAPDEAGAGVWLNAARMNVLRTPKALPGPELGIAALGFQSWYEARHGQAAYEAIVRIARGDWAEYLHWYRHFLDIPVRYGTRLARIEPAEGCFRLYLESDRGTAVETARKVILANGVAGNGGPYIPEALSQNLPPRLYAHTADMIDFAALRGKTVAVVGGAASAFDAAGVALEAGAAAVHLFARRASLAATPISRVRGYPGAYDNYHQLPDAVRWHQAIRYRRAGSTAPADALERVLRFDNFHLHLAAPLLAAREEGSGIVAQAADGEYRCDFAIAGTGYFVDPQARPELADFAGEILLWRDRYTPAPEEEDPYLGAHPYLGTGQEYLEKTPGAAPYLRDIQVHNPAGFVSGGWPIGDVPSMKRGIPTVVAHISRDLFLADLDLHQERLTADVAPDFAEAFYASAVWPGSSRAP
ncbi:MAG TPA: NAD(P)/FAD-dependent oxidoreductase [Stellaceae bacterium]|jgi:cation diffusion facilitator CzcD-associated flavoprotein CzcO|nr:NAD(P)/FAD-dependent oxidoreductase [Stellaceae bacterium]